MLRRKGEAEREPRPIWFNERIWRVFNPETLMEGVTYVSEYGIRYHDLPEDVEAFDQSFPEKEKKKLPGQIFS